MDNKKTTNLREKKLPIMVNGRECIISTITTHCPGDIQVLEIELVGINIGETIKIQLDERITSEIAKLVRKTGALGALEFMGRTFGDFGIRVFEGMIEGGKGFAKGFTADPDKDGTKPPTGTDDKTEAAPKPGAGGAKKPVARGGNPSPGRGPKKTQGS
ncbi:MAG: hypothetical protein KJ749_05020 [Planctomycetes bacterium]|nr:hypothetical protein [Planctomycetota bacterium]